MGTMSCHHPALPCCRMALDTSTLHPGPSEPLSHHTPPWQILAVLVAKGFFWRQYSSLGACDLAAPCSIPPGDAPGWSIGRDTLFAVGSEGSVPSSGALSPFSLALCSPPRVCPLRASQTGIPNGNVRAAPLQSSPTLGELDPLSSASACLFLILDVIEGGKCDRKEGRLFFPLLLNMD